MRIKYCTDDHVPNKTGAGNNRIAALRNFCSVSKQDASVNRFNCLA